MVEKPKLKFTKTAKHWSSSLIPGYLVKIDVDKTSGCIMGLLICPEDQPNPSDHHIHVVYNSGERKIVCHTKVGDYKYHTFHKLVLSIIDDVNRYAPTLIYATNTDFKDARNYDKKQRKQIRAERKLNYYTEDKIKAKLRAKLLKQMPTPERCKGERDFERKFDEWAIKYQREGFSDPWSHKPFTNYYNGY